jgi:hypothetical protein
VRRTASRLRLPASGGDSHAVSCTAWNTRVGRRERTKNRFVATRRETRAPISSNGLRRICGQGSRSCRWFQACRESGNGYQSRSPTTRPTRCSDRGRHKRGLGVRTGTVTSQPSSRICVTFSGVHCSVRDVHSTSGSTSQSTSMAMTVAISPCSPTALVLFGRERWIAGFAWVAGSCMSRAPGHGRSFRMDVSLENGGLSRGSRSRFLPGQEPRSVAGQQPRGGVDPGDFERRGSTRLHGGWPPRAEQARLMALVVLPLADTADARYCANEFSFREVQQGVLARRRWFSCKTISVHE